MAKNKNLRILFEKYIDNMDLTEVQLEFLIKQYLDENTIIGIHNTFFEYGSFFEKGLRNRDYTGVNSRDLSRTVFYSDKFVTIMCYPNGEGQIRGETSIVLKIPKKVFLKEQGIFEVLPDGRYGIPPQFIVGAFSKGNVVENQLYDPNYTSHEAIKCTDKVRFQDKAEEVQVFRKVYEKRKNKGKFQNLINLWKSIRKRISKVKEKVLLPKENTGEEVLPDRRNDFAQLLNSNNYGGKNALGRSSGEKEVHKIEEENQL